MKNKKNKDVKTSKRRENTKTEKFIEFLDRNRKIFYGFIGGVLIAAIVTTIIWPERIATLSDGTQPVAEINGKKITADVLYEDMKEHYDVSLLLKRIDTMILSKKYEETDEMMEEINNTANSYYTQFQQSYNLPKEDFLAQNGLSSHEEFIEVLKLSYLRNEYYDEYAKNQITEKEIDNYYKDKVYGDIDSKHMLVTINEERKDEDAKKLAQEIIEKLNEGKTFDEVKEEYKDKITYEELGYRAFNANIQQSYMLSLKDLKNGEYTKEPVQTTYGYHIIYRIDQKEKPSLEDVKEIIIEELAAQKKEKDKNLYYKALANIRKENNLKFFDTVMENRYEEHLDAYK